MIDRIFTATLTFALLAGGTLAVGSALFDDAAPAAPQQVVQMPAVTVIGTRASAPKLARNESVEAAAERVQ